MRLTSLTFLHRLVNYFAYVLLKSIHKMRRLNHLNELQKENFIFSYYNNLRMCSTIYDSPHRYQAKKSTYPKNKNYMHH